MGLISYGERLTVLAERDPGRPAITCGELSLTRAELESRANRLARHLQASGVGFGDMVTIALPNSTEWFVAFGACWKIGAIPQPVSSKLPEAELRAILELANPRAVAGVPAELARGRLSIPIGYQPDPELSDDSLPPVTSPAWKAPTSGGSTGRPKLIVAGEPAAYDDEVPPRFGTIDGCMVMPGPLYHNGPIVWSCSAWLAGSHVVVLPRFDAEATLAAIDHYQADNVYLVPTMMKRIWRLPEDVRNSYDMSSLRTVWHLAEPCPEWLKQVWIDWLGPERIFELYAGTEAQTATVITGSDWLAHRGSVGRPIGGSIMICDPEGNELPTGEEGEVWMLSPSERPTYHYIGATARTREGGWESLGDVGRVDDEGYLYLGDRMQDMILTGGANVYPAEVEAALQEHPSVRSVAVIGLPDEELGNIVHAIVEAEEEAVPMEPKQLLEFVSERLARYKVPRSIEYTDEPIRDDAGKVRRSALRAERVSTPRQ
jgi:bile acid-coenzyme A ligase